MTNARRNHQISRLAFELNRNSKAYLTANAAQSACRMHQRAAMADIEQCNGQYVC